MTGFVLLILLLFYFSVYIFSAEQTFEITDYQAQVKILENGDIQVKEIFEYNFNGDFNGILRTIGTKGSNGFQYFKASEYFPTVKELYYNQSSRGDMVTYKIYDVSSNEKKLFLLEYQLKNVATLYNDTAEFYWKFFDESNTSPIGHIKIEVELPFTEISTEELKVFGHGPLDGKVSVQEDGKIVYEVFKLSSKKMVEVRILFPVSMIPNSGKVINQNKFAEIMKEELGWAKKVQIPSSNLTVLTQEFPYLRPPDHLSTSSVIRLEDGELLRSATSKEDMQTLVGSIFGADTYFEKLNEEAYRKEVYKQVLREIVLMNVLEQDRKWLAYLTAASKAGKLSLDLLDPELMGDFFYLYRTLIDNSYLLDNNVLNHSLNYLKQFGRMDTHISRSWWQAIDKLKLHEHTLEKVGTGLSFASFISSIGSMTLSAVQAMNQEIATVHLTLISETLEEMEGHGEYFSPAFKQALGELIKQNDSSFISDFTQNLYYEWEKEKDDVTEKGLSLFMDTAGKKAITTTLQKAGLSHAALPALAWSFSIQFSVHVIQSGLKGIDLFHRYVLTTDTLFYLRKMHDYSYANQQEAAYLSFNLLDATSQLYAYQLLEALMNTTPQKLMFWKLGARKLVLAEITSTQEELLSLFPGIPLPTEEPEKPEMITWEKTFGGSDYDMALSIIQTTDGGYAIVGVTESKGAGEEDAWLIIIDSQGNMLWDRTYGGSEDDGALDIIQTTDNGFTFVGYTETGEYGGSDAWGMKLDDEGALLWEKIYGGSGDDYVLSLIQTSDGGYAATGYSMYEEEGEIDTSVVKMDSEGNVIWEQGFGEENPEIATSIIQTTDGGYAVLGFVIPIKDTGYIMYKEGIKKEKVLEIEKSDIWITKLNPDGTILWNNVYGGREDEEAYSLVQTTDGGYIIGGYTKSKGRGGKDAWIIKLDSIGNIIWEKAYGGNDDDLAYSLVQTTDGGYAIAGSTDSKGEGELDIWFFKLDEQGNLLWEKTYGGSDDEEARSIIQTTEGGYAIAGFTYSKGAGGADVWILKLDEQGKINESSEEDSHYALRDTGPAGGYIFYDKGSYSDGWRYLEAAPESTEWKGKEWGSFGTFIGGTGTGIGTGKSNTAKIVTWLHNHGEKDRAVQLCDALVYGGYSDWFLPSRDELDLMYENLHLHGDGGFDYFTYISWSSSEFNATNACYQYFSNGNQSHCLKGTTLRVRAVRAF